MENVERRTVNFVSSTANHRIRDGAAAVSDLSVEDGGLYFDFLHCFGRGNKPCVAGAGEALGWIVGDAVEGQAIVTGAAVGVDLDGCTAEWVGEGAGLALEVAARSG